MELQVKCFITCMLMLKSPKLYTLTNDINHFYEKTSPS